MLDRRADRRPVGLHRGWVGDLEFDDEIGGHGGLPWRTVWGWQLTVLTVEIKSIAFTSDGRWLYVANFVDSNIDILWLDRIVNLADSARLFRPRSV